MGLIHLIYGGLIKDAAQQRPIMRQTMEMWVERVEHFWCAQHGDGGSHVFAIARNSNSNWTWKSKWHFKHDVFVQLVIFFLLNFLQPGSCTPTGVSCILLLKCQHKSAFILAKCQHSFVWCDSGLLVWPHPVSELKCKTDINRCTFCLLYFNQ